MNEIENIRPLIFIFLFILFSLLEYLIPKRKKTQGKRNITNLLIFASGVLLMKLALPFGLAISAFYFKENEIGIFQLYKLPATIQIISTCILFDFFIYWQHRLSHKLPFFWRFHHIHHSDQEMDITTGVRFHPAEILMSGLYKIMVIFIFTPSAVAYLIYESVLSGFALFNHSNIKIPVKFDKRLRLLFATPDFHTPHHSPIKKRTNSNFGNVLSIWDYLFKTYDKSENSKFGLESETQERSRDFFHLLKRPFTNN